MSAKVCLILGCVVLLGLGGCAASKYPPAQGMILALGEVLLGEPIVGVWLSTAAACATVGWMLKGALPRRWATIGAALVAMHPLVLDWSWCFWGGSVAMGGGALLIGATIRLRWCARATLGMIAGIGMAILANSRPLEGAILSVLCAATMVIRAMRTGSRPPRAPCNARKTSTPAAR